MKLINEETGKEVKIGDMVVDFRGDGPYELVDCREPHKPSSTGRVYCKDEKGNINEWFPGVVGCKWVEGGE